MGIAKRAFTNYTLDEEKSSKRDQFTVELNREQRDWLNEIKVLLDIKSDAVAVKLLLEAGKNAMITSLSRSSWKYLLNKKRQRLSDFENLDRLFERLR